MRSSTTQSAAGPPWMAAQGIPSVRQPCEAGQFHAFMLKYCWSRILRETLLSSCDLREWWGMIIVVCKNVGENKSLISKRLNEATKARRGFYNTWGKVSKCISGGPSRKTKWGLWLFISSLTVCKPQVWLGWFASLLPVEITKKQICFFCCWFHLYFYLATVWSVFLSLTLTPQHHSHSDCGQIWHQLHVNLIAFTYTMQ